MAGGQEVLEGLEEVPGGHWLVVVEAVVSWLNELGLASIPVCDP